MRGRRKPCRGNILDQCTAPMLSRARISMGHFDLMVPTFVHAHRCGDHRDHLFESISCILRHALDYVRSKTKDAQCRYGDLTATLVSSLPAAGMSRLARPKDALWAEILGGFCGARKGTASEAKLCFSSMQRTLHSVRM